MRTFNPRKGCHPEGHNWVQAYGDRYNNGESFAYESEHIAQLNMRDLWHALLQIEYFETWFHGSTNLNNSLDTPVEFGVGQPLPSYNAYLIKVVTNEEFTFRHGDAFFRLNLIDFGPSATLLKLRCFDFNESRPGFLGSALKSLIDDKNKDQSSDIENTRQRLVRLEHLAEDLMRFGEPINETTVSGKVLNWVVWRNVPGVLSVLPDMQGNRQFREGSSYRAGKIGYVVPDFLRESGNPERFYIERWYVKTWWDGTIAEIRKNHGDQVSTYERLVLIESAS